MGSKLSPSVFAAKKTHREKRRSTDPDLTVEEMYNLLCSIFYIWEHNRKPLLQRGSMAGFAHLGAQSTGKVRRPVQIYRSISSPLPL